MPNKFTIEQQIVRAKLQSGDKVLENQAIQEITDFPSLGTLYSLKGKKFTQEEIGEVGAYIQEQKKKYPDSLQELFALWESLVQAKKDILTSVGGATAQLRESVEPASFKEGLKKGIIGASKFPFSFEYTEDAQKKSAEVDTKGNTLTIGGRKHIFTNDNLKIQEIKMDKDKIYIGAVKSSKNNESNVVFTVTKKEFLEQYLDDILAGKDIKILDRTIKVEVAGDINKPTTETKPQELPAEINIPAPIITDTIPGVTRRTDKEPEPTRRPTVKERSPSISKPVDPGTQVNRAPVKDPESKEVTSYKKVLDAHNEFIALAIESDKWLAGLRNTKEDITATRQKLSEKYQAFNALANSYLQSKGSDVESINKMRLNLAYYYSGDLKGVSSNNQIDIIGSQNICLDILGKKISKLPTSEEQLYSTLDTLKTKNPKLADLISSKIQQQQEKGEPFNLSIILSNPLVKGGWENAYNAIYGESLKKMDNELDVLKGQKYDTLSETEKKALNHLRDIRGKDGIFDFTAQNREQMWQMLKYGGAIAAGIVATIPTGGASLGMLALGAGIGATVTTGGVLLAQGYRGSAGEVAQEAGINLISFGGGALLFKLASGSKAIALAEKTSKVLIYGVEGVGNIGIGVGTDMLRANLHGEDLDTWSSIQQNLIWAALPFAIRMKGGSVPAGIQNDANIVENIVKAAKVQTALGKSPKKLLDGAKDPLSRLKFWGEKNTGENIVHRTEPVPNTINNLSLNDQQFSGFFERLIPVVHKKNFPVGSSIRAEGLEIVANEGGKYTAKYKGVDHVYDSRKDLINSIGKLLPEPAERLAVLKSTESAAISSHMMKLDGKTIPEHDSLRWRHEKDSGILIEKKDDQLGSWKKTDVASLSKDEQFAAVADFCSTTPTKLKHTLKKAAGTDIHSVVSAEQKEGIIKKHGKGAWAKIEAAYHDSMKGLKNGGEALVKAPFKLAGWVFGWQKGTNWQTALGLSAGMQVASAYLSPNEKDKFFDSNGGFNWSNIGEGIAETVILKNLGGLGSALIIGGWEYYDLHTHTRAVTQVPSQGK